MHFLRKTAVRGTSPFLIIAVAFGGLILLGTILLMLPVATRNGQGAPFADALFTATSAACVTGLVVHNTATYWSLFGQAVILVLIQVGGLGVVTVVVGVRALRRQRISLRERTIMQESLSASKIGGVIRSTRFIIVTTIGIELIGALLLLPVFVPRFGWEGGSGEAIFHAVSAFCPAGFDLLSTKQPYQSLMAYSTNVAMNLVIGLLILIGGIGFITWIDVRKHGWHIRRYRLQSKIVLVATVILLLVPMAYFFCCEFQNFPMKKRLLASFFQTVSPRTAGFNTVPLTQLSDNGQFMTILLMFIGGGTGSMAGGIKMTTAGVLFCACLAVIFRRREVTAFGRRIAPRTIFRAAAIFTLYLSLLIVAAMVMSGVEHLALLTSLFECASALDTVGLTLGVTPLLHLSSRLLLILLMFIGRVGSLTVVFAVGSHSTKFQARYPEEPVNVG